VKLNKSHIINKEEEQLYIQKLKRGDELALEYFFNKYYKYLVVTAYKILHDDFMAKDIVQDVFFHLWEKRSSWEIIDIKSYLRRAVYNKSIDVIRKKKRKGGWTEEITDIDHPQESSNIMENIEANELQEKINKAIDSLPDRCRTIFCLSRFENLSHKEIASQLDISVKTIENQITKALKIMRKHIYTAELLLLFIMKIFGL